MKNNKVALVTGSSGFIGSHLLKELPLQGYRVFSLPHEWLLNPLKVSEALDKAKPDYIFNLAAYGNMINQKDEPEIFNANLANLYNLLQLTRDTPYTAFVNVSTSSVTLPTQTLYSATKMGGEYLCKAFADSYDKPIVSVRPYTVIGVGEQEDHLIPRLIKSCLKGEKMEFVPHPTHDFVDIDDVVSALLLVAQKPHITKGKVYEVGQGRKYTNEEIKGVVEKVTGRQANLQLVKSLRKYDSTDWLADNTAIIELGWKPTKNVEVIIQEMIQYETT